MRALAASLLAVVLAAAGLGACSSSEGGADPPASPDAESTGAEGGRPGADATADTGQETDGSDAAADVEADAGADADPGDAGDGGDAEGPPAVQLVGRFDVTNPAAPRTAWPGGRMVARFTGTAVSTTLSQANGLEGGNSWFNVIVDGVDSGNKIEVTGQNQAFTLASGLAPGVHTIELEKRTEANLGTVTFHGFTFPGGQLLAPPPRPTRRIEFLAESTIDGFGVEGDVNATCMGGAPPQFHNARKSLAAFTAKALGAEHHLLGYSGKGVARNNDGSTNDTFPTLFLRTLPEDAASTWSFASWVPDVVVISLGGTDYLQGTNGVPANFQTAYADFVAAIRTRYPNAHVFLTVWSQIKDLGGNQNVRTALRTVLDAIVTARAGAGDTKVHRFQFTEATFPTDETGCYYHANAAHHQAMANELVTEIKAKTGWP